MLIEFILFAVCLTCFSCSGVADLNSCDATVTCDQGQVRKYRYMDF
jgi:hypothetical protein